MNPLIGESKNLLTAGKVIGSITDPAIYHNSAPSVKRGDPYFPMGRSSLMEFANCPQRWKNGYEGDESKATEWGSLVDCLFLTPSQFKDRYAVSPEVYPSKGMKCPSCGSVTDAATCRKCKTNRMEIEILKPWDKGSTFCSEWEASQAPKTVIKAKLFGPACDATKVLQCDPDIKALRDCSSTQVMATASYQDVETGIVVPLKILIDMLPAVESDYGKAIADLKTANCAAVRPWNRAVFDHGYATQAALYLDVWTANTGEDRVDFLHVVQESFAPYQTEKRMLSSEFIELGRMKYLAALSKYCQCLKSGIWPGYEGARMDWNGWQLTEPEPWMVQ